MEKSQLSRDSDNVDPAQCSHGAYNHGRLAIGYLFQSINHEWQGSQSRANELRLKTKRKSQMIQRCRCSEQKQDKRAINQRTFPK